MTNQQPITATQAEQNAQNLPNIQTEQNEQTMQAEQNLRSKQTEQGTDAQENAVQSKEKFNFLRFIKKNAVCCIAFLLAVITSFIVPPSKAYLAYFDFKTLFCLFSVSACVCALKGIKFFYFTAQAIVRKFKTARSCVVALVCVTFIGSMLIANDMALITFLPLGYLALSSTGKEKYMPFTFIMQNIAANLGGMLTPFGNPQNLFLYGKFNIPTGEFTLIMLPPFLLSVCAIILCCVIAVKNEPLDMPTEKIALPKKRLAAYLTLFALSIVMVFRILPYYVGTAIIVLCLLFLDRSAFKKVDYSLLFTFVFFFIFAGNTSKIAAVRNLLASLLEKNTLLFSVLSCQCISNVPSAILLSEFTTNYKALLLGVNIGGTGTPIASLASLITLKEFSSKYPRKTGKYLVLFSAFNFAFLIALTLFCSLLV